MKNLSENRFADILWKPVLFISLYTIVALTGGGQLIFNLNIGWLTDVSTILTLLFVPVYLIVGFHFGKQSVLNFKATKKELVFSGLLYSLYPVFLLLMDASLRDNLGAVSFGNNIFILPSIVV